MARTRSVPINHAGPAGPRWQRYVAAVTVWRVAFWTVLFALLLGAYSLWTPPAHAQGMACAVEDVAFRGLPPPDRRLEGEAAQAIMAEIAYRAGQPQMTVTGVAWWVRHERVLVLWRRAGMWCQLSPQAIPSMMWNGIVTEARGKGA